MNIPHKQLDVDINRKNNYTVDFIGHVNDKDVRYIDVSFNADGTPIELENGCKATVTYVSEGVLIDQEVECTIDNNAIIVGIDSEKVENLRSGILEVQPKIVGSNDEVLTIQVPILVRISPDIAEHGRVDDDSLGSYAEVVREIAAARGSYTNLKDRLDHSAAPSDEQVTEAVEDYFDEHPVEANGNSIWKTSTAPTEPAAPERPGYGFTIANLTGADRDVQLGDIIFYSYYYYTVTDIIDTVAYAESRVSIRGSKGSTGATGAKGDPGDDYVLTAQDKAEIAGMVDLSGKEDITNKKESISKQPQEGDSDTNYPTVEAVRDFVDAEVEDLEDYIDKGLDELAEAVKGYKIPSYWESALSTAIGKVKAIQRAHGADCINLVWFSDIHLMKSVTNLGRNVPALAAFLSEKLDIPFVISTGDAATNSVEPTEAAMRNDFNYFNELTEPIKDKLINCFGNHDGAWGDNHEGSTGYQAYYAWHIRPRDYWNDLIRKQTIGADRHYSADGTYGYIDLPAQKLRIVQLNSFWVGDNDTYNQDGTMIYDYMHHGGYGQDQLDWLAEEALLFNEDGWSVLFMAHMPPASIDSTDYTEAANNRDALILNGILTAYANKSTYSGSYTYSSGRNEGAWANVSVNVDFSSETHYATPIMFMAGHCHKSRIDTTTLPFPIVTITCATNSSYDSNAEGTRTNNSATETAFDVVSICKDEEKVYLTRLGVGTDREVSYSQETPPTPPVNQIPISTDENGDIYNNGLGYKDDYRFNSSGAETSASGYFVTGYIPVSVGDTVTFDGFTFGTLSGTPSPSYCYIEMYDSNKDRRDGFSGAWVNSGTNADSINAVRDSNGYLTEFEIVNTQSAMANAAYIRISGYGSGANAEIYVE